MPQDLTFLGGCLAVIAFPFAIYAILEQIALGLVVVSLLIVYGFGAIRSWLQKRQARWLDVSDEEFEVGRRDATILRARFDDIVDIYMVQMGGKPPFVNDYVVVLRNGDEVRFPVHGLRHRRALVELFETKTQRKFRYRKND